MVRQKNLFLTGLILGVFFPVSPLAEAAEGPVVTVQVGESAPALVKSAADELAGKLTKLFDAQVSVQSAAEDAADSQSGSVILLGNPETNSRIREIAGKDWPELSDQGHLLKSVQIDGKDVLIVGGGSPVATFWAVCELGHRFGIRYTLQEDYLPVDLPEFTLAGFDEILEPNIRVRAWRLLDPGVAGFESWGSEDIGSFLGQLAKLKFNRVSLAIPPGQDPGDPKARKKAKLEDLLWAGAGISVSGDTAGRSAFDGARVFENPLLVGKDSEEDRIDAGWKVIKEIEAQAGKLGLEIVRVPWQGDAPNLETFSLANSNGGLLPQFFTSRLEQQVDQLRKSGGEQDGKGFQVRCWVPGNLNPDVYYLSRASFDGKMTPAAALNDLVTPICGEGVAARLANGFAAIEKVSALIEKEDAGFAAPDSNMFMEHFDSAESAPEWWATATEHYGTAVNEMYRGNTRARGGARSFILYHAKYFTFALHYMTAVDAARKAGIAKSEKDNEAWVENLELAVEAMHNALGIYSEVARDNSDRGAIAVLNEYAYQPLVDALNEAPLP